VGTVASIGGDGHYLDFEGVPLKVGDRVVVGANVSWGAERILSSAQPAFPRQYPERLT
jgi:hypothetical protein